MSDKYFIDKDKPGYLRKVSNPTSGLLVGINAPFVCEALNNYTPCKKENEALQAKVDSLMFEYCPDEMTPKQISNYEKHQVQAELTEDEEQALAGEQP